MLNHMHAGEIGWQFVILDTIYYIAYEIQSRQSPQPAADSFSIVLCWLNGYLPFCLLTHFVYTQFVPFSLLPFCLLPFCLLHFI